MGLLEFQVDYNSQYSNEAKEYRKKLGDYDFFDKMDGSLRDVCVFYYETGYWEAQMAITSCSKGVKLGFAYHAEEAMIAYYNPNSGKVKKVYTEFQCCGTGKGMHNCSGKLEAFLKNMV